MNIDNIDPHLLAGKISYMSHIIWLNGVIIWWNVKNSSFDILKADLECEIHWMVFYGTSVARIDDYSVWLIFALPTVKHAEIISTIFFKLHNIQNMQIISQLDLFFVTIKNLKISEIAHFIAENFELSFANNWNLFLS